MKTSQKNAAVAVDASPVFRAFVRGPIACKPEYRESEEGVGICRVVVLGVAAGPASKPPRVSLYIQDGGALRAGEARRCAFGLQPGDVIQAVGAVGGEREKARNQEVVVSEPVRLRARAARSAAAA